MAFSELIKNFDLLRDTMRDFFVYGYKTRADFESKSARTYDNEKRRIESYLGQHINWDFESHDKRVFLSIDASNIAHNPLHQVYRSKSFTDNDIMLHFFILDVLEQASPMTVGQVADEISLRYGETIDIQTVRGKLNEYVQTGLLKSYKQGKAILYEKSLDGFSEFIKNKQEVEDMLSFFGEIAPFSVIGTYLGDRISLKNKRIGFKHHFLAHTLEDNILLPIIEAMEENRLVELTSFNSKREKTSNVSGLPLSILVSEQTGRRYLYLYTIRTSRYMSLRLDNIRKVKALHICENFTHIREKGEQILTETWGASVDTKDRRETLRMTIFADEEQEQYIINRLRREGRGGFIERVGPNQFRYTAQVSDSNELMNWVKTFTGRIISVEGENKEVISRFNADMKRMQALYGEGAKDGAL